jgi:L-ascorbate metabolism protein UlaG (beta-lactamase superfamily)
MRRSFCAFFLIILITPTPVWGACRNMDLADKGFMSIFSPALAHASPGPVRIEWYGHSFFQIASSRDTRVFTDPFGSMGYPMPDVSGDIVTVGREHGNHNNVELIKGNPKVFRGLSGFGENWSRIQTTVRDVLLYNVPIYQRGFPGHLKGAAFVFEMDGLCVAHLGDLSNKLNPDQLDLIGRTDIALVPIGGRFTMDPVTGLEVVKQLEPKIAIPMHYWNNSGALESFTGGPFKAEFFSTNTFTVSKDSLPTVTTIYVLKSPERWPFND